MDRRELLKMIALLTGGVMIGGNALLTGCSNGQGKDIVFSKEDQDFLNEVADTILPPTKSPGAKAALVGPFMAMMVNDCYEPADQRTFYEGIALLNADSKKLTQVEFVHASPEQKKQLLISLDAEAKLYQSGKAAKEETERKKDKDFAGMPNHYFTMMKQLTLLGYFSSEEGCKQALRYIAIPGSYQGDVPYKKGDKAWA